MLGDVSEDEVRRDVEGRTSISPNLLIKMKFGAKRAKRRYGTDDMVDILYRAAKKTVVANG